MKVQFMKEQRGTWQLDELDTKILRAVERDGRASLTEIARKVGLTKPAVKYRLDKLIETGVIKGFFALVDSKAYGKSLSVVFDLTVQPRYVSEVARRIAVFDEVIRIYELTNPELHVHALFSDQRELDDFLTKKLYPIQGISAIKTGTIMRRHKIEVSPAP